MTIIDHPNKGSFDTDNAQWHRTEGDMEYGFDNDLVGLRRMSKPEPCLIYTLQEWEAFLDGVRDGEFDKDVLRRQPIAD